MEGKKASVGQQACFISYMEHECASLKKRYFHSCPDIFLAHNLEANTTSDSSEQIIPLILMQAIICHIFFLLFLSRFWKNLVLSETSPLSESIRQAFTSFVQL